MPREIRGLPYWEITFDKSGSLLEPDEPTLFDEVAERDLSDLIIFSHGWNNDPRQARLLYTRFFATEIDLLRSRGDGERSMGVAGVVWPSKAWADEEIPEYNSVAAGVGAAPAEGDLLRSLKDVFDDPEQQNALDELAALLDEQPRDAAALERFQQLLAPLAEGDEGVHDHEPSVGSGEVAPEELILKEAPETVFESLADPDLVGGDQVVAVGLGDVFDKLWAGAKEAARQVTYWTMKKRAGVVGRDGLGPLIGRLVERPGKLGVHLVGHSFGARLVSFALAGLPSGTSSPVKSLFLIQGAFSHYAFADALPHDRARGGALKGMAARVDGPLVATHSVHDSAVGRLYPLASVVVGSDASGIEELSERWQAIGHDGAQGVMVTAAAFGRVGSRYDYRPGKFTNLNGDQLIKTGGPPSGAHSDIFHPEIAWAHLIATGLVAP